MIWVSLILKSQRAKLPFCFLRRPEEKRLRTSQRACWVAGPLAVGLEGASGRSRCHDPNTNLCWPLSAGHHREWLCPHHGRAAAKDCAVPTGRGQGPQAPRGPEANHSPLRTGMSPGLQFFSRSYSTTSDRLFIAALVGKMTPWSFAHLWMFIWSQACFEGELSKFLRQRGSARKLAQLLNEVIKCTSPTPRRFI